jgi:outer membrane protein assembly factor BamA
MDSAIRALSLSLFMALCTAAYGAPDSLTERPKASLEFLPILSYDTDAGLGYGVKIFSLNRLRGGESFDLVLFNSTKGERWYKLVFSLPDFDLRQGTVYPLALDITVDYDKWISYKFFGVGNASTMSNEESYTREPVEVSFLLSKGLTREFVAQAGLRFRSVKNDGFGAQSRLSGLPPALLNSGTARYLSLAVSGRYDTRESYTNPHRGVVLEADGEYAPQTEPSNVDFSRYGLSFQYFSTPLLRDVTVALRCGLTVLQCSDPPVQILLPVGGGSTLRGFPQDRYLDKVSALVNLEVRFPIIWRFGGIAGYDLGKVWHALRDVDVQHWASNPVAGLRFYFDTFIVRLDAGFSNETTGFYLNFGHIF